MKRQIADFVRTCDVCQRKQGTQPYSVGLLDHLPIPQKIWADISMDLIDGLPLAH